MKLHDNSNDFASLIQETAQSIRLPEIYIEKDYWVTNSLKNLSTSAFVDKVVFKGGTSLSKAHHLIHRFSEDIDLVIIDNVDSDGKRKKLIKDVEKVVTRSLKEIPDDHRTSKGSKFRRTVYEYHKISDGEFGVASPQLLVEINSFTTPKQYAPHKIQSLIADYLQDKNESALIEKYNLESFQINVLGVERTLAEKILRCVKDSYQSNHVELLSKNIRHLYDIHQILNNATYREFVESDAFHAPCKICIENEKENEFENSACLNEPLEKAPLFIENKKLEKQLKQVYTNSFSDLVYGELPDFEKIMGSILFISTRLK